MPCGHVSHFYLLPRLWSIIMTLLTLIDDAYYSFLSNECWRRKAEPANMLKRCAHLRLGINITNCSQDLLQWWNHCLLRYAQNTIYSLLWCTEQSTANAPWLKGWTEWERPWLTERWVILPSAAFDFLFKWEQQSYNCRGGNCCDSSNRAVKITARLGLSYAKYDCHNDCIAHK